MHCQPNAVPTSEGILPHNSVSRANAVPDRAPVLVIACLFSGEKLCFHSPASVPDNHLKP